MIDMQIEVEKKDVQKKLMDLSGKSKQVIAKASNATIKTARKTLKDATAEIYNVKKSEVEEGLKIRKASEQRPYALLRFRGDHKNLLAFGKADTVKPRYPVRSSSPYDPDPANVTVKVLKSREIPFTARPKPFVQIVGNGIMGLFRRVSDEPRAKIKAVKAPAMPQIIKNDKTMERFQRVAGEEFKGHMDEQITRTLME